MRALVRIGFLVCALTAISALAWAEPRTEVMKIEDQAPLRVPVCLVPLMDCGQIEVVWPPRSCIGADAGSDRWCDVVSWLDGDAAGIDISLSAPAFMASPVADVVPMSMFGEWARPHTPVPVGFEHTAMRFADEPSAEWFAPGTLSLSFGR